MWKDTNRSIQYINEFDQMMSLPQGTESYYALNFYLLSKFASNYL